MKTYIFIFFLISILLPKTAKATLGETESSVEKDRQILVGTTRVSQTQGCTVHEISAGIHNVKEYVNSNGVVFAVTWAGTSQPDLSTLFGTYFSEYQTAEANTPKAKGRAPYMVRTSKIVVMHTGHMRSVRGKAVVTSLVPSSVNPDELQ